MTEKEMQDKIDVLELKVKTLEADYKRADELYKEMANKYYEALDTVRILKKLITTSITNL